MAQAHSTGSAAPWMHPKLRAVQEQLLQLDPAKLAGPPGVERAASRGRLAAAYEADSWFSFRRSAATSGSGPVRSFRTDGSAAEQESS